MNLFLAQEKLAIQEDCPTGTDGGHKKFVRVRVSHPMKSHFSQELNKYKRVNDNGKATTRQFVFVLE